MQPISTSKVSRTRRLSLIAIGTALALSTNYLLAGAPNVKLMDLIVFIVGFIAGPLAGAATGALTWLVYGTFNPYGGVFFSVWVSTLLAESLYGIAGGILGRRLAIGVGNQPKYKLNVILGATALGLTFAYDLLTSFGHAFAFGISLSPAPYALYLLFSAPFFLVHELSNLAFFATLAVPVIRSLSQFSWRYR